MRSTPTAGMESVIGLPPLYLHCREIATNAAYRLHKRQKWRQIGYSKSHRDFHLATLGRILPNHVRAPEPVFRVNRLPPPKHIDNPTYNVFTDGSKDKSKTGYGWCLTKGNEVLHEESHSLDSSSSVFMAEMLALIDALLYLKEGIPELPQVSATIWTDSLSSKMAIYSSVIKQPLALEAHDLLLELQKTNQVEIEWVRGHSNCTGNELADFLAKKGRDQLYIGPLPALYTPLREIKQKVRDYFGKRWAAEWAGHTQYNHSKFMLPKPCPVALIPQGTPSIKIPKEDLKTLFEVITGHCLLKRHLRHWIPVDNTDCTLCGEDDETYFHLVFECPALSRHRQESPCNQTADTWEYYSQLLAFVNKPNIQRLRRDDLSF